MVDKLGESAVPYNPTIIEKGSKLDFSPSLYEFLSWRGTQVVINVPLTAGAFENLIVIPEGHVLFITGILITAGAGAGLAYATIESTEYNYRIAEVDLLANWNQTIQQDFSIPLLFEGGTIRAFASANISLGSASIIGFLLASDLMPQF